MSVTAQVMWGKSNCPNCGQAVAAVVDNPVDLSQTVLPCMCVINEIKPMNPILVCPTCNTLQRYQYAASTDMYFLDCGHAVGGENIKQPQKTDIKICGDCKHGVAAHTFNLYLYVCTICNCLHKQAWFENNIISKDESVTVNPQFNKKIQQSYVRLKSAGEEINELFFENNIDTTFFGETVRDAIAGGLVDNFHAKIWAPDNKYWRNLIFNDLARRFERVNHEYDEEPNFLGQWKFKSKFGDKTVCFYSNQPTPIWSCDMATFNTDGNQHTNLEYMERTLKTKLIDIVNKGYVSTANHEKELLYAAGVGAKYGWTIGESSLAHINGIIEELKPLPEITDSLIVGFRIFAVKYGVLQGYHNAQWKTEKLDAVCDQDKLKQHLQSTDFDRGEHGCGIYIYKDAAEAINEYKNDAVALVMGWGNAFEGERGWRVEHCRIDKLWIWDSNKRPDRGQYNIAGGIILGAKQGDFFREIYTSGVDFENTHSRW
jgi:hypothetical protein